MTPKYDVFIVYSSENTKEARKFMEDIERRFHIKSCFPDRDFVPGAAVVENISNAMERSKKIVFLISRHFIDSGWCWFEEQAALRKYINIQEKRSCIIPVMLEDIEMPKRLRNMTFVDFEMEYDPVATVYNEYLQPAPEGEHSLKTLCSYYDGFEDAEERLESLKTEVDEELQNYSDEAERHRNIELQENRNCIIQMVLEVEMPKHFLNMTYIDFQKEFDPEAKVCDAYLQPAPEGGHSYEDSFKDAEERLESLKDEVGEKTLQNYFDEAVRHRDLELLQCILKNNHTKLTSKNIFNFCVHLRKDDVNEKLVESVFQKLPRDLSLADYKNSYIVVCARDISCLVSKFNALGCQSLINASFVCEIIPARHLKSTEENCMFTDILKDKKWKDDDLQSFLDVAMESRKPAIIKVLLSLVSTIPLRKFPLLIFEMDEETCVEVFLREKYEDGKHLLVALRRACLMNMETLVREILKQGLQLQPIFLLSDFSFGIVKILIKEYPWCLQELHEIGKVLTKPSCRRLLQSEIKKKTETAERLSTGNGSNNTDKCTVLYERNP